MNQDVLLLWFQKRRKSGDDSFISVSDLEQSLFKEGNYNGSLKNVRGLVNKMYAWGFLELEKPGAYNRAFRCKIKVLDMNLISPLDKNINAEDQRRLR